MPWVYVGPIKSTCMWGKPLCLWRGTKDHVFLTFWKHHLVSDIKSGYLKRGSIINEAFLRIFPEHVTINSLYRCIVTTCRIAIFGLVVDITTQLFIAKVWTTQLFIRVWIDPNQINFAELMHSQVFKEQYWRASNSKLVIFSQLSPESSSGIWHFMPWILGGSCIPSVQCGLRLTKSGPNQSTSQSALIATKFHVFFADACG